MIDLDQLRALIVRPVLERLNMAGENAENLVIGTGLVESRFKYVKQIKGPALGFYQCEPATYTDIRRWLLMRPEKMSDVLGVIERDELPPCEHLMHDIRLATVICRLHYWRKPGAIPDSLEGQGEYWKTHYNTYLGAGTVEKYVRAVRELK